MSETIPRWWPEIALLTQLPVLIPATLSFSLREMECVCVCVCVCVDDYPSHLTEFHHASLPVCLPFSLPACLQTFWLHWIWIILTARLINYASSSIAYQATQSPPFLNVTKCFCYVTPLFIKGIPVWEWTLADYVSWLYVYNVCVCIWEWEWERESCTHSLWTARAPEGPIHSGRRFYRLCVKLYFNSAPPTHSYIRNHSHRLGTAEEKCLGTDGGHCFSSTLHNTYLITFTTTWQADFFRLCPPKRGQV